MVTRTRRGASGEGVVMSTSSGNRARLGRALTAAGVAAVAILVGSTAADAAQFQKVEHYSGTFEEDFELCGFDVHHVVEFGGTVAIRSGDGQAFYGRDNYAVHEVFTNTANGKWFALDANGVVLDLKATHVEDTVYEFVTIEAGQPFVVRNMDGRVVLRDRGRLEYRYLFDTLGDGVPSGFPVDDLGTKVAGPHPGFDLGDEDLCIGVTNLIG